MKIVSVVNKTQMERPVSQIFYIDLRFVLMIKTGKLFVIVF